MANYHMEIKNLNRTDSSLGQLLNYVSGLTIRDIYLEKSYYKKRSDVLMTRIYLPKGAPQYLSDLQRLCDEIHKAEKRYDARTARSFICSLPNELPFDEQVKIVSEFIEGNFTPSWDSSNCGYP